MSNVKPGPRYQSGSRYLVKSALFDIDNTLVGNASADMPSERFKQAVLSAHGKINIGVATARSSVHTERILRYLQAEGLSILCNGAQIVDSASGEVVAEWTVKPATCRDIVAYARSKELSFWINNDGEDIFPNESNPGSYERLSDTWDLASRRLPANDFDFDKAFIIVLHDITDAEVHEAAAFVGQHADTDIAFLVGHETVQAGEKRYDAFIGHKQANKKDALHYIAIAQGLDAANIMAVGDGRNDAELIGAVGVGIAMGNSAKETLAVATFITADQADDGAALALEYAVSDLSS